MTSAAPARKPYRKAPPQHREMRQALPTAPPTPEQQLDVNQVNQYTPNTPPSTLQQLPASYKRMQNTVTQHGDLIAKLPLSDSELEVSSLSSLELCIPPPPLFSNRARRPGRKVIGETASDRQVSSHFVSEVFPAHRSLAARKQSQDNARQRQTRGHRTQAGATQPQAPAPPKGILKQSASLGVEHNNDAIRKSKSVEMLEDSGGPSTCRPPARSQDRAEHLAPSSSSAPPSPTRTHWNWRMQVLEEKVRFSNFLDEITCRVLSPDHLTLLGMEASREQGSPTPCRRNHAYKKQKARGKSAERRRRWDDWVAAIQQPDSRYRPLKDKVAGQETPQLQYDIMEGARHIEEEFRVNRGIKIEETDVPLRCKQRLPVSNQSVLSHIKVGHHFIFIILFLLSMINVVKTIVESN